MTWAKVTASSIYIARHTMKNEVISVVPLFETIPGFQWSSAYNDAVRSNVITAFHIVEVPDNTADFLEWTIPYGRFTGSKKTPELFQVGARAVMVTIEIHFENDYD